jgi:hypothetical protein
VTTTQRPRQRYASDNERITLNVHIDEQGCWVWQRYIHAEGYGYLSATVAGKPRWITAHRYAYLTFVGPIAAGLQLDHLCRNRACCNPLHLEPVRARTNVMRSPIAPAALNARKTHCPQGHAYDEANTIHQRQGGRLCRTCQANRRTTR